MFSVSSDPTVSISAVKKTSIEERISFVNLSVEHLDYFYVWASDPFVAKNMTWEPYSSREEAERFLREVAENHPWFKAICLDGAPVGSITITQGKGNFSCKAEIGYVLARPYWGQGIATVAVKKAIQEALGTLTISRIEALVDPDNIASQKVLVKAGMRCEGLLKNYLLFKGFVRDRYIYSFTK